VECLYRELDTTLDKSLSSKMEKVLEKKNKINNFLNISKSYHNTLRSHGENTRIIRKERDEEKWPENQEELYKEQTPASATTRGISAAT
jgi:hypothetical protein